VNHFVFHERTWRYYLLVLLAWFGPGSLPRQPCTWLSKPECFDFICWNMHGARRSTFCLHSCKWPIHPWLERPGGSWPLSL